MSEVQIIQCPICGEALEVGKKDWERQYEMERKLWKNKAHKSFDAIWKTGVVERTVAYSWLAKELGIEYKECHFANLSLSQLKRALAICELAKARMLKAFCETEWEPKGKHASLPFADGVRNSLNKRWVHDIPQALGNCSERKLGANG